MGPWLLRWTTQATSMSAMSRTTPSAKSLPQEPLPRSRALRGVREVPTAPPRGILRRPKATTGFWSWWTTIDHKKIGILYGATAIFFLVVGGVEALLIRLQLAGPDGSVLTA